MAAWWCVACAAVALLYALVDVNYFLRLALTIGVAKLLQRRTSVLQPTSVYSVCLPSDVDACLKHMNNARFVRELDFARFDFYFRCGLFGELMVRRGGNAVQGASAIRYRRPLAVFSAYRVDTQMVWWDDKAIYLEQRFVTLRDGFVRAVSLSKQSVIGVSADEAVRALAGADVSKPDLPEDLRLWLDSLQASSAKLRPKSN
ncbi:protein THEM6 [Bacillus rossius redtenbacheri]|uniref:protein THEM6 n=1 Tax=Bacillus rossius redtenbacheri TaxID=93214 RepID=UPI002FDD1506